VDAPPEAVATLPATARVGQAVTLDASGSSDPQGYALVGFDWTCDDGTTASGMTASVAFDAVGPVTCELLVTSSSGLSDQASGLIQVLGTDTAAWTVMVYLAGDNDLEEYALGDMNEMEVVGSTAEVNVVVQLDRSRTYSTADGNWSGSRRYLVEQDSDQRAIGSPVIEDLGAVDSGRPETIVAFATWAAANFPAERYALVLWDHGWGWYLRGDGGTKGIAEDQSSGNDISVAGGELEEALDGVTGAVGRPLDLLGMDACLMATWEVQYVSAPWAGIFVGSQASEGMDGWAYDTTLADLVADPAMDAATLGETIARRFFETRDSTQSVINLDLMGELTAALDRLAQAMLHTGAAADLLEDGAGQAQEFEHGSGTDHDLGDFLDRLEDSSFANPEVLAAIDEVQEVRGHTVLANYVNGREFQDATGMSIYTPTYGRMAGEYSEGRWADETLWDDFIDQARGGY
jgi:hypothetical protein